MAQKRMIDKKISVSEQVVNLGRDGALLFTWMIPHADDFGLLPFSTRTIKALVVPMFDYTLEDVGIHLEDMLKQNLIRQFQYKGDKFWRLLSFRKEQSGLKKDRQPATIMKLELDKDPKKSWEEGEKIVGIHLEDNGIHLESEEKRREEKGRELKGNEPKVKEEKYEEKPIIPPATPSGSGTESPLEKGKRFIAQVRAQVRMKKKIVENIFDNPEDRTTAEESAIFSKTYSFLIFLLFLFTGLFFPVSAHSISLTYKISSPFIKTLTSRQLVETTKSPSQNLVSLVQPTARQGIENSITPIPKLLTDTGAKNREWVLAYVKNKYYSGDELTAFDNLLKKEAGYRTDAINPSSGACGIGQSLPCEKMGCSLSDLECQTQWTIGYINRRYGSPVTAWQFWVRNNWY